MPAVPATLDGSPVLLGDRPFDVVNGMGTVVELLADGKFVITFGNGRRLPFNSLGTSRAETGRTLFWHDPVLTVPPKSQTNWLLIRDIAMAAQAAVKARLQG